jgi:hypothetical protein
MEKADVILETMEDTGDPRLGAVFEKTVNTNIAGFDAFMKNYYPAAKGEIATENSATLALYYENGGRHVGIFNFQAGTGYFGGIRVGSQNSWLKPGEGLVKNPFVAEESRKTRALESLAGLVTEISGERITLERENGSARLLLNGEVLEQFSIWGDSPLAVLFDAMQAVIRHKGRIL